MGKKCYVGNMNYDTTEDTLRALFAGVGEVESVSIITDRRSGRSKGFGFVEMATEEEAQAAISQLNGTTLDGRQINVAEARPQRPRSDRGGGGRRDRRRSWDY
jgi:RNA recognition motif-containing protein